MTHFNKSKITLLGMVILTGFFVAVTDAPVFAEENGDLNLFLNEARLGKWTEDYDRLLRNYKKVLELEPGQAEAEEAIRETHKILRPLVRPQFAFYGDSEDLDIDSYGSLYEFYPIPATRLQFQYGYHYFEQHDRSADKDAYRLKINHRLMSQLAAGFYYEYNDYDKAADSQSFAGDLYFQLNGQTALYAAFHHNNLLDVEDPFSIYGWNIIGDIDAIFEDIETNDTTLTLIHNFSPDLRYQGSFTFGDYSDGNEKKTAYNEIDWKFWKAPSPESTEAHLKYSHFLLDYSKDSPFYWSPNFFNSHSLVIQIVGRVVERVKYLLESGVSYSPESAGVGYRVVAKLEYTINDDWLIEGSAFYFDEPQEDRENYWSRKFTAAVVFRF